MLELPPFLNGTPENQALQLRNYLIRLAREIDERLKDLEEQQEKEKS